MIKERTGIVVLFVLYTVGGFCMFIPSLKPLVLPLSPLNLFLSFFILLNSYHWKKHIILGATLVFFLGFIAEWIGVHTSLLFGHYWYGSTLGPKINGIPLIIGINWAMLTICSVGLSSRLTKSWMPQALLTGAIMTATDWIMEPVAVKNDYWQWKDGIIPIYNYICWFGLATLAAWLINLRGKPQLNNTSLVLFILINLFFFIQLFN